MDEIRIKIANKTYPVRFNARAKKAYEELTGDDLFCRPDYLYEIIGTGLRRNYNMKLLKALVYAAVHGANENEIDKEIADNIDMIDIGYVFNTLLTAWFAKFLNISFIEANQKIMVQIKHVNFY